MKKVLIITNLPTPYKINFYKELGKYCDLTVVIEARRFAKQNFNWNDDNITTFKPIYLDNGYLKEHRVNFKILRYLNKGYDRIVVSAYHMPTELLALAVLKLRGIHYWFESDGGMINNNESKIARRFKTLMISGADGWISPSDGTDKYLSYYGADKSRIYRYPFTSLLNKDIYNSPATEDEKASLRKKLDISENKVIVAVGQFIHRKGFDVLMKAAAKMSRDIGVYIIGGEPTEEYIQLRHTLKLDKNIHFVGFKSKSGLQNYYRAADLFVLPTREDIWGLVINEAMGCGLPVITTDRCVAGVELIKDKQCLIPVDNVEALKNAVTDIICDPQKTMMLSMNNIEKIKNYSIEKMAERHAEILHLI